MQQECFLNLFFEAICHTARYHPYSFKSMTFARGALGEKSNEYMKEWVALNPMPPDTWLQQLEATALDARVSVPATLAECLEFYDEQLNENSDLRVRGPIYRMNAQPDCC